MNRAVARATGETFSTINHLGFLLADLIDCPDSAVDSAQVIDWDELESGRNAQNTWRPHHELALV